MLAPFLARLVDGASLTEAEAEEAFAVVMRGDATPAQLGALLMGLRLKGETPEEVAGAARALRRAMVRLPGGAGGAVDTCGTGGGRMTTTNISTGAAFVAAGAGVPVAKHGNRSFTSRSGSADVLEALGVDVFLTPERAAAVLAEARLVFLFAPNYHPAMRHAAAVRRDLAVTTVMNLLGPLANPAGVRRQVVGVAGAHHGPLMAEALRQLDAEHALVVHADIGMDEISPKGATQVWEVAGGGTRHWTLHPAAWGLADEDLSGLGGNDPKDNARGLEGLVEGGAGGPGLRTAVLLNAAAAIYVSGTSAGWDDAVARATASLDSGAAGGALAGLRRAAPRKAAETS